MGYSPDRVARYSQFLMNIEQAALENNEK